MAGKQNCSCHPVAKQTVTCTFENSFQAFLTAHLQSTNLGFHLCFMMKLKNLTGAEAGTFISDGVEIIL